MKSIFRMGIPVVGKNYFPSNIQGLPTWYEVRASEAGYLAPSGGVDIMVAMNAETYDEDLAIVDAGGYLLYDSTWPRENLMSRDDITVLGVPLARMCNENFDTAKGANVNEEHSLCRQLGRFTEYGHVGHSTATFGYFWFQNQSY